MLRASTIRCPSYLVMPSTGEIQKGTGGRGRDRKCHKLSDSPLCAMSSGAHASSLQGLSCAHKVSCDSPGEFGKLSSALNRSAGPTLGVHSAWACQAARSSVHDSGLHSSELAVRLANEYGINCRKLSQIVVTFYDEFYHDL